MLNQKPSDYPTPRQPGALRLFGLLGVLLWVLSFSKGLATHTATLNFGPTGAANLYGFEYNDEGKGGNPAVQPDGTWDSFSSLTAPAPFLGDKGNGGFSDIYRQVYQIDTANFGTLYGGHELTGIDFKTVLYKAVGAMETSNLEVYYLSGLNADPDINSLGDANDWGLNNLTTTTTPTAILAGSAPGSLTTLENFLPLPITAADIDAATVTLGLGSQQAALAAMRADITAANRLTFVIGTSVNPYDHLNNNTSRRDVFEYSAYGGTTGTFGDIGDVNSLRFELTFADGTTTGGTTTGGTTTGGTTTGGTTTGGTTTGGTTTGGTTTGGTTTGGGGGGGGGGVVPEPRIAFLLLMGLVAMQLQRRRPRASA